MLYSRLSTAPDVHKWLQQPPGRRAAQISSVQVSHNTFTTNKLGYLQSASVPYLVECRIRRISEACPVMPASTDSTRTEADPVSVSFMHMEKVSQHGGSGTVAATLAFSRGSAGKKVRRREKAIVLCALSLLDLFFTSALHDE